VKEILKISVFQFDLVWEDAAENRAKIDQLLGLMPADTDVVFLPEMFSTGFTMNVSQAAETMSGETLTWLQQRSRKHRLAFCGSLTIQEDDLYYNRLVFVDPSGNVSTYDKRHLFSMGNEGSYFQAGSERLIVEYQGWRICPLICYDLRFPVWSRNRNEYDLLMYCANWPESRKDVWNTLLKARAIENQSYVVGANRVGVDGNKISYSGNSQLIDAKGKVLASVDDYSESIIFAEFSYKELMDFRTKFPVLDDTDEFVIK
jgi:predicted amidohydrolase